MTNDIVQHSIAENQSSPFDSIRRFKAEGTEYWSARELLKWLGYEKWQNAEKAITRAGKSLCNQNLALAEHVIEVSKVAPRAGSGDLSQTLRSVGADYVPSENLGDVLEIAARTTRQRLIGE